MTDLLARLKNVIRSGAAGPPVAPLMTMDMRQTVNGSRSGFEEACARADAEARRRYHSEPDEVDRLAKLPRLEYDRQREDTAKLRRARCHPG
jgi:hypothetical protein